MFQPKGDQGIVIWKKLLGHFKMQRYSRSLKGWNPEPGNKDDRRFVGQGLFSEVKGIAFARWCLENKLCKWL